MSRPGLRIVSLIVAIALGAVAVIAAVESVLLLLDTDAWLVNRADWARHLRDTQWSEAGTIVASIGAVVVGLALLAFGARPGRPITYPTHGGRADLLRHGLEAAVTGALDRLDGVRDVRVRAGRRRLDVSYKSGRVGTESDAPVVRDAAERVVARAALANPLSVRVKERRA